MSTCGEEGVKVLSRWSSPFGMRVLIALKEKGVAYEYEEEELGNKSPLLLSSNPVHKMVPVLLHNGRPVCESIIIVQYIDDTWPSSSPFLPSDPHQRAYARFWADFIDKKYYGAAKRMGTSLDLTTREQAKEEYTEALTLLDKELSHVVSHDSPFFGGKRIGLIDIAFAPFAFYYKTVEDLGIMQQPGPPPCPHLSRWIQCLLDYPSVKEVMASLPHDEVVQFVIKAGTQDEREVKRQRRKQSNRESARRSRLRKQTECEELATRLEALSQENTSLRSKLNQATEEYKKLSKENRSLLERLQLREPEDVHG